MRSYQVPWARIAWGWLTLGLLLVASVIAVAVGYYVLDMPVHMAQPGRFATSSEIMTSLVAFGGGGGFFAVMGMALPSW